MAKKGSGKRKNRSRSSSQPRQPLPPPQSAAGAASESPASSSKSSTAKRNAKRRKQGEWQKKQERRDAKAETERLQRAENEERERLGLPYAVDYIVAIWADGSYSCLNRETLVDALRKGALGPDRFYTERAMPLLGAEPDAIAGIYFKPRHWERSVDRKPDRAYVERAEAYGQVSPLIEWDRLLHGLEAISDSPSWVYLPRHDRNGHEIAFELGPERPRLDEGFPLRWPDFDAIHVDEHQVHNVLHQQRRVYIAEYPPSVPAPPAEIADVNPPPPKKPPADAPPETPNSGADASDVKPAVPGEIQPRPKTPPPTTAMIAQPARPPRRAGPFDDMVMSVPEEILGPWSASARRISGGHYDETMALTAAWLGGDALPKETSPGTAKLVLEAYWVANWHFRRRPLDDARASRLVGSVEGRAGQALLDPKTPSASGSRRDFPLRGGTPEPVEQTELGSLSFVTSIFDLLDEDIPNLTANVPPPDAPEQHAPAPAPSPRPSIANLPGSVGRSGHVIKSNLIAPQMHPSTAKVMTTDVQGKPRISYTDPTGKQGHHGELSILRRQKLLNTAAYYLAQAQLAESNSKARRTILDNLNPLVPVRVDACDMHHYIVRYPAMSEFDVTVEFTKKAYDYLTEIDGLATGITLGDGSWTPNNPADAALRVDGRFPLSFHGCPGQRRITEGKTERLVYGRYDVPMPRHLAQYADFTWAPGIAFPGVNRYAILR